MKLNLLHQMFILRHEQKEQAVNLRNNMVKFSEGYKNQAKKRLIELEKSLDAQAWAVACSLKEDFANSSQKGGT